MKYFLMIFLATVLLSSCLKQSISDALLSQSSNNGGSSSGVATMSYKVNGNLVQISVNNPDDQASNYNLSCSKGTGYANGIIYSIDGLSPSGGEMSFTFYTDSLTTGNYIYTANYGPMYFMNYNGDGYVAEPLDSLSFNITSYSKGHISGNFSGRLTPLVDAGYPDNIYGTPGSILVTHGTFQNVPVFYQ